ncbi:class I glutamine amidotransferase-like protein [Tothia fuscella]|uniref:Class I glutamine amidotransferase-like protein n=1 Tax=Tothia fuscella TaxID=1048955 RepID=A0A9P4NNI2_9PEZI|nr:class I glutamine amidotransferase-like protein [Tothia fuscella]
MKTIFNLQKPDRAIRVGVILLNATTEILDVAPIDLLGAASKEFTEMWSDELLPPALKKQSIEFEYHWVTESGKDPALLTSGIRMLPTHSFETCPPLDIVLMGAHLPPYSLTKGELSFIRKSYHEATAFLTICGGFVGPLEAGILQGKAATAPRTMLKILRESAPDVHWVEKRWARDGKLWTSGTLLNGIDLMAAFIRDTWGENDTLQNFLLKAGGVTTRDVDYEDVSWKY